jgi:CRISPR system Cascade subunit CasA
MSATFSLAQGQWIPARMTGGRSRAMSLIDLLQSAHEIEDLAVPVPPAASGLWRILYALTARVTGLDDPEYLEDGLPRWHADRAKAVKAGQFDAKCVAAYFEEHADRFDLFGPRPFLQDPRLAEQCSKSSGINKLVFSRPSGNNHAWWTHTSDAAATSLGPAEAAWWLIAQLYYGASGRCTSRTVNGSVSASTKAGPLRSAISFHPVGRTVFESLLAGLPAPRAVEQSGVDLCPWETSLPDPLAGAQAVTWPGRLLAGRARHAALLVASEDGASVVDAYVTWGDPDPVAAADPYVVQNMSKEGRPYSRPADAGRAVWRDLDALLLEGDDGSVPPAVFADRQSLPQPTRAALRVRAFGFDQDGQATDKQYFVALTPEIYRFADAAEIRRMRQYRVAAEQVGNRLAFAAKLAWGEASAGGGVKADARRNGPWSARALAVYWPEAERLFWQLLDEPGGREPTAAFVGRAESALEAAVGQAASTQPGAKALSHATAIVRAVIPKRARPSDGGAA